jgi:endoglycosylceramidase
MRRLAALALTLVLAAPALAATGQLHSDGQWVRDARGRVILLRGLNYSGLEFGNVIGRPNGPAAEDFAQMASWGVNVIRLPVAWHYLEPQPGVFDRDHLRDNVDPIVEWARRNGMRVVIELHQFQWSPCTGGNGMPAWSCEGKGYARDILGAWAAQHDFWAGAVGPDGVPLVERFLQVWERVAKHYRRSRTVVGFNFLNEPLDIQAPATFEHDTLYPFYREAVARVRAVKAKQMIVLEPPVTRNLGVAAQPEPVGDDDLLYAPHLYTVTGGLDSIPYDGDRAKVDADYALAERESSVQGAILWPGEYGGVVDAFPTQTTLFWHHTLDEMDERLVGGAGWAYFPSGNGFSVVTASGEEKPGVVDALVRPYPMETAGIPLSIDWDRSASGAFVYRFAEDTSRRVADPTVIFVPERHFPNGFTVETTPGDVAIPQPDAQRVLIRRDRTRAEHTVTIRPLAPPAVPTGGVARVRSPGS